MNFELKQHFQIESARYLPLLSQNHPCSRMHGHSFKIILTLVGPLNPSFGWVQDYNEISEIMNPLLNQLDHRILNEIPGLNNPTSELLAAWIYDQSKKDLPLLRHVTIIETSLTECRYPAS